MQFYPIYVISLARATDRREKIVARLNAAGVEYEICDAVDGDTDIAADQHRIRRDLYERRYQGVLTDRLAGCFLSHEKVWARMAQAKIPVALILEDDAVWDDDFFTVIEKVLASKWQWDVVMLGRVGGSKKYRLLEKLSTGHLLIRKKRAGWRTTAYLVRLSGANKLLSANREITSGADSFMREYWRRKVQIFDVAPPIVQDSGAESLIGEVNYTLTTKGMLQKTIWRSYRKFMCWYYHLTHPPQLKP